jgi:hypothetical protein
MTVSASAQGPDRARIAIVLRVAWLAILLGIVVEIIVVGARLFMGAQTPVAAMISEFAQGISWGVIVCAGVAIGVTVQRARAALGGLMGAISGPVGWGVAKSAQRSVQALMGTAVDQFTPFFFTLVAVKGVEYLVLGLLLGRLAERADATWRGYALTGAIIGAVTAAVVVALNLMHGPVPMPKLAGLVASEFTFPIGCALVIYAPTHVRRFVGMG